MRPLDAQGRAAILRHYLQPLRLADDLNREALADDLAAHTDGTAGADLAFLCQAAARQCVQEALRAGQPANALVITAAHLARACEAWQRDRPGSGKRR
jgi:SpoVK/Ycf46/Vps4 family AAA+-type ATPase